MTTNEIDQFISEKMSMAGVASPTIQAFLAAVSKVRTGERGMVPETDIEPIESLPAIDDFPETQPSQALLRQLAVIKLNGGLGTGMGLDRAKSLIPIKAADNFLDFTARQILHLRRQAGTREPAFYLMDSFSTQQDTLDYLGKYPDLAGGEALDFLQSKVPKLDAAALSPISWPEDPELEWCPPGHGDIYPSLVSSGLLESMLKRGIKYLFVSNSDNLGATVDPKLVKYFAETGLSFLMEVAARTPADSKGGHLARRTASRRLLLRESAQCLKVDEAAFQNIDKHHFFNTNNLWIRLDHLEAELGKNGGTIPLPLITNNKTVDPRKLESAKVLQLESAMGAAIECFDRSGAVLVPRSRFSPVKSTGDLLALRSDAYRITEDHRLVLDEARRGQPPLIQLDSKHYKVMADFDACFGASAPSLLGCDHLTVSGKWRFETGVVCQGRVEFINNHATEIKVAKPGIYSGIHP